MTLMAAAIIASASISAQESANTTQPFQHFDVSLTAGTTGLGIDVAAPLNDFLQLRAGYAIMPRFNHNMTFGVQVGDDPTTSQTKFERLQELLTNITGFDVNNEVDMIGKPTYYNFSLMLDVKPFNNKHWRITGGFYLGPSTIAKAYNATEDMPSLLAVGIYNHTYDKLNVPRWELPGVKLIEVPGYEDLGNDPELLLSLQEKFLSYGRMGIHVGDYADGSPYMMEPDENSMAKARIKVNSFKPYLGFGYEGRLLRGNDDYLVGFDCGALFWGGTPSIITHDGTDLARDVDNISGKVGDYVDLITKSKLFPVLNLRLTRRF